VAMAVGLRSANFPLPLLHIPRGLQVLTHLLLIETRGAKLELLTFAPAASKETHASFSLRMGIEEKQDTAALDTLGT
ncbi:MAG: hypothetical protein SWE60_21185, partial [Thermodesulfobacteriota bacterium]|nr:hypothetical protein [Thermodesulfobacteriota bacterium]